MGEQLSLSDVTVPMFVVGTETDHVAPWRSVYKAGRLVRSTDYTFCLTSGGHNAGIISGPQHPKRRHRVLQTKAGARLPLPDKYLEKVEPHAGLVVADVGEVARGTTRARTGSPRRRWAPRSRDSSRSAMRPEPTCARSDWPGGQRIRR